MCLLVLSSKTDLQRMPISVPKSNIQLFCCAITYHRTLGFWEIISLSKASTKSLSYPVHCQPGQGTATRASCPQGCTSHRFRAYRIDLQLPGWLSSKEPACQSRGQGFDPWVRKSPWRRKWQLTPIFLPAKSHEQGNLPGYSPWRHKRVGRERATNNNKVTLSLGFFAGILKVQCTKPCLLPSFLITIAHGCQHLCFLSPSSPFQQVSWGRLQTHSLFPSPLSPCWWVSLLVTHYFILVSFSMWRPEESSYR